MRSCLYLAEKHGQFLFQIRPDLFPEGYLTETELQLWNLHYEHRAAAQKGK